MAGEAPTTLMFPLRTSVELFRDPASPAALLRAKQGAVLYERLMFERGLYDATLTGDGSTSTWHPSEDASDEELQKARTLHDEGTPMQLSMGIQPARGVPADPEKATVILEGPIQRHYVAEWESVLRDLEPLGLDWIEGFSLPDYAVPQEARQEIGQLNFSCLSDRELMPEAKRNMREFTYKAFHHDAVIASERSAVFSVTSQFVPMLDRDGFDSGSGGEMALDVWAPALASLSWERVLEFRDHPGAQEARGKLRDLEQRLWSPNRGSSRKPRSGSATTSLSC